MKNLTNKDIVLHLFVVGYRVSRSDGTAMSLQAQAPAQRPARYSPQETVKVSSS